MAMSKTFTIVFYTGSALALLANIFLIISCCRFKKKNFDVKLAIILASIDLVIPASSALVRLLGLINNINEFIESYELCVTMGALRLICVIVSSFLVATIAYYRFSFIAGKLVLRKFWILVCLVFGFSIGWIIFSSVDGRFELTPGSVNCAPVAKSSYLAAATLAIFGLAVLIFITITIYCNIRTLLMVAYNTQKTPEFTSKTPLNQVRARIVVVTIVYFVIAIPASIIVIGEGFFFIPQTITARMIFYLAFGFIPLANPCLILFTHSLIHRQFIDLLKNLFALCFCNCKN